MHPSLLCRLLLTGWLLCPSWAISATAPPLPPLVLHDFERTASPTPGVTMRHQLSDLDSRAGQIWYRREPAPRATSERALHLYYRFNPETDKDLGWRLTLPDLDASDYDHLEFWIRGDAKLGYADALRVEFRQSLPDAPPDLLRQGSTVVTGITADWQRVQIPLNLMTGIDDWQHLRQFGIVLQPRRSPITVGAYWLDDIALIKTGQPGPSIHDPVITPRKTVLETQLGGKAALQPYLFHDRTAGWPTRLTVPPTELPADDRAFLQRLARDTWRGLAALSDRDHGLPFDTVRFHGDVTPAHSWLGDYTNVTNIGLYLIDIVAAAELGLIDAAEAQTRLNQTLDSLERLETWRGFYFNYYDTTTLERTSHFVSFVDSAWLTTGLMVVRNSFPTLTERCTRLIDREDYSLFYDPVEQLMAHGYHANLPYRTEYYYGLLYSEARLGSLIAIGKGDVPVEHWYRMVRAFPRSADWQSQSPKHRVDKMVNGYVFPGGYYTWKGYQFVPSWGGAMFEALMPTLVLDEQRYAPASLGQNGRVHTAIQRRFALEHLGYPVWGLSPSSTPASDDYSEYGARLLGARGYAAGAVTPHAAALALLVDPAAATANLRQLVERYPVYGDFGFYDAVAPRGGQVAYNYLALDQSMILIALADYLRDGVIQRYFAADPIMQRVLPLLGTERFFD